jgi:hypothetical protein
MRNLFRRRPQLLVGTAVITLFSLTQPASAARLLKVFVMQEDATILHAYYDDGGRAEAATVWRYLQRPPKGVDETATVIPVDAANPLLAKLEGDVTVGIQHADRIIAQARVSSLALRRLDEKSSAWFLPAAEVERTAVLAGLGVPTKPPMDRGLLLLTVAGLALPTAAVVGLLFAAWRLVGRQSRGQRLAQGESGGFDFA